MLHCVMPNGIENITLSITLLVFIGTITLANFLDCHVMNEEQLH